MKRHDSFLFQTILTFISGGDDKNSFFTESDDDDDQLFSIWRRKIRPKDEMRYTSHYTKGEHHLESVCHHHNLLLFFLLHPDGYGGCEKRFTYPFSIWSDTECIREFIAMIIALILQSGNLLRVSDVSWIPWMILSNVPRMIWMETGPWRQEINSSLFASVCLVSILPPELPSVSPPEVSRHHSYTSHSFLG